MVYRFTFFSKRNNFCDFLLPCTVILFQKGPGSVALSLGHLTHSQRSWVQYPVWPHTLVSPSADSSGAVVSYCRRKYVHEVLVNRLRGLSLPRKRVVRLTDRPDMTLDVYRGRKTTNQQLPKRGLLLKRKEQSFFKN